MRNLVLLLILWPAVVLGNQVPLADLMRHPEVQDVQISPGGTHIAVRRTLEGKRALYFMSLNPLKVVGILRFSGKTEVGNFKWANNKRVVAEMWERRATLETPINYGSLYAVNYDGTQGKEIFGHFYGNTKRTTARIKQAEPTYAHSTIIDTLKENDKKILISTSPWSYNIESYGEVLEVNIYTGAKRKIIGLPQAYGRAYTGGNGNLTFATGVDKNRNPELYQYSNGHWNKIEDPILSRARPIGTNQKTGETYLEIDRKNDTEQLIKLHKNSVEFTPIFESEISDISGYIYKPGTNNEPIGVYTHPDYPKEFFFNDKGSFPAFFKGLKKAFDGYRIRFTSTSSDGSLGILAVYGDRLPTDYFFVNMKSKRVDILFSSADWLDPEQLNPMHAESFVTSDGLRIGTYLTFPKDREKKLPLVVLPHGGPHNRDYWGYSREAQILSQNGYLVLQVNFRGSTGYGNRFYNAGKLEWGGKIQKDIADSVKWAIDQGYAHPDKVCIFGGSFGGYSALMNPIKYPDLYKCAIGYVGVYDLEMMYTKGDIKDRARGLAYLKEEISNNKDFMIENSPIHNIDKLNIPLFIIHGVEDKRVPVDHANELLEKLAEEGKPAKSLIVAKEGHGFYSEENNLKLYTQLLEFLDQHIGVGAAEKESSKG